MQHWSPKVMDYSSFSKIAEKKIHKIYNIVEQLMPDAEVDLINNVLYINTQQGNYVINQHYPSKQIWLSSPISNAGYFDYHAQKDLWLDKNGNSIELIISKDLDIEII
jgi:frataxin